MGPFDATTPESVWANVCTGFSSLRLFGPGSHIERFARGLGSMTS